MAAKLDAPQDIAPNHLKVRGYYHKWVAKITPIVLPAHFQIVILIMKGSEREQGMKRTRINTYSLKKIAEKNAEAPIRIALCKRAGGTPITREVLIYHSGQRYSFIKVECLGGTCECGLPDCPKRANSFNGRLEPHELLSRGKGGKLSLENTIMVLRTCHRHLQNREPKLRWIK